MNFEVKPYLSDQTVIPRWPKTHDKNLRTKRAFKMK